VMRLRMEDHLRRMEMLSRANELRTPGIYPKPARRHPIPGCARRGGLDRRHYGDHFNLTASPRLSVREKPRATVRAEAVSAGVRPMLSYGAGVIGLAHRALGT
jgi:hypothetical protein